MSIWNKARFLYRQMKIDPEGTLLMDVGEDELELLLEKFKAEEIIKLTAAVKHDPELTSQERAQIDELDKSLNEARSQIEKSYRDAVGEDEKQIKDLLKSFERQYKHTPYRLRGEDRELYQKAYKEEYNKYKESLTAIKQERQKEYKVKLDAQVAQIEEKRIKPENPDKPWVRQFCLFLLGEKDTARAREIIARYLNDRDNDVSAMAAIYSSKSGNAQGVVLLGNASFQQGGWHEQAAIFNLYDSNTPEINSFLLNNLNNGQPGIRYATFKVLSNRIDQPNVKEALVWGLDDPDPFVQAAAIEGVTPWADAAIMEKVKPLLFSSDPGVQVAAIRSVGSRLDTFPENLGLLIPKLNDDNLEVALNTIDVLGPQLTKFEPQLKQPFLDTARNSAKPIEMQQGTMLYLAKTNAPEIKTVLVDNLENSDWRMRQVAVLGLGYFKDSDIPDILAPKVYDPDWHVCQGVAVSLGEFDTPKAIESSIPLLRHDNAAVRQAEGLSFGGKLQKFPELVSPFIETMKLEEDPYTRHIFAAALKTIPNDSAVKLEMNTIQDSLIPGLRIDPWEQVRPETGVEIGYDTIVGPILHTFISVTYQGDTRILSFDTTNKPLGFLLPQSEGEYLKNLKSGINIMYYTVTIDPAETKRLYDLAPSLYQKQGNYNLFDIQKLGRNCYGARNTALESAGIYSEIPDMPWEPLKPNYFSRSVSMDFSDRYSSYSFRMRQEVLYSLPNIRTTRIDSVSHYQTNRQFTPPASLQSPSSNSLNNWGSLSIPNIPSIPTIPSFNYTPTYQPPTFTPIQPPSYQSPNYQPPTYQPPTITPLPPASNLSPSSGFNNWP